MARLLLWILSWFAPPDLTARVAVEAAYVLHTQDFDAPVKKCCGACKDGVIVHGDGHKTACPCPDDCECKTKGAVVHPQTVIKCEDGKCLHRK
jgi:hypothetical protein